MGHYITEKCDMCELCLPECPTSSIIRGEKQFFINYDTCKDCAVCVMVCPIDAIQPVREEKI